MSKGKQLNAKEKTMPMIDAILPEFDHEAGVTRRLLERVPEAEFAWAPHTKSMTLGRLATHVADVLTWLPEIVTKTELALDTKSGYQPKVCATRAEVLALFDHSRDAARNALASASDAELLVPWTFKVDGQVMFVQPRVGVVRGMVMNHMIHHRGQLSVYLRLKDVPLPSMYGPSADEGRL
jgi:uncharacterized damage-inducible protein DinB